MQFHQLKRREFITLVGGATTWPLAARAQQGKLLRRIGVLMGFAETDAEGQRWTEAFRQGLQELGWAEGRNVQLDYRWTRGEEERVRAYAVELVELKPEVILAHAPAVLAALRQKTRSVPIVFVNVADPVGNGFVASLAAPGGNITGFTNYEFTIGEKWLEILKELAPNVTRVMVIVNPANPTGPGWVSTINAAATSFAIQVIATPVAEASSYKHIIESFAREPDGGLIVLPDIRANVNREQIIAEVAQRRLPAVYPSRLFATGGGLVCYGPDPVEPFRRASGYVDRILKGEKPANLPVQAPTKFQLVINLKTARSLDLLIPDKLLAVADEVIE
jgi:putative ABC transport system substrate-binding protein